MSVSRKFGNATLRATCANEYNPLIEGLFDLVGGRIAAGAVLRDGVRIPFGWTVFTVREDGNSLRLFEPDFDTDPAQQLRENLDFSLSAYRRQQLLIDQLGLTSWSPLPYHEDVVAKHGVLGEEMLLAKRLSDSQGVSGWFVFSCRPGQPVDPNPDVFLEQYGKVPVWHLVHVRPALFDVLALPVGFTAKLEEDTIKWIKSPDGETWGKD